MTQRQPFLPLWKHRTSMASIHALPIDTHALVLYYNKSIAAKAGLLDEQGKPPPITPLAIVRRGAQERQRSGRHGLSMETFPCPIYAVPPLAIHDQYPAGVNHREQQVRFMVRGPEGHGGYGQVVVPTGTPPRGWITPLPPPNS